MDSLKDQQIKCCSHYDANYTPVKPDQLVVISDGICEGVNPVEGVRYPSPEHMSGWWLTTDDYNGDVDSLQKVHFHHIEEKRPDLALYMSLPFGYRFFLGGNDDSVWYDEAVANDANQD